MPEALSQTLALPGVWSLILAMSVAGIVRGFSGFGTALIFVPVAGLFLSPAQVVGTIVITGIFSTAALLPRAWRQGNRREVGSLVLAALPTVPLGLWVMQALDPVVVRWIVAVVASGTLAALVSGWRYTGIVSRPKVLAIGAVAGLIGLRHIVLAVSLAPVVLGALWLAHPLAKRVAKARIRPWALGLAGAAATVLLARQVL